MSTAPEEPSDPKDISILFVCLGNICRSPMAEGVFQQLLSTHTPRKSANYKISHIDSAGTGAYHAGSPPDPRTTRVLRQNGIAGYKHAATKVSVEDFTRFSHIVGMDEENYEDLVDMKKAIQRAKKSGKGKGERSSAGPSTDAVGAARTRSRAYEVADAHGDKPLASVHLYGEFGGKAPREEVIDPYYGGNDGFSIAFEQMERFGKGFLKYLDEGGTEATKQGKM